MAQRRPQNAGRALYARKGVAARDPLPRFLIVCEGEQTEKNYFEGFRVSSAHVVVHGTGRNTLSLVEYAIFLKDKGKYDQSDQLWCVFDRDSFTAQQFNEAIRLAEHTGFNVAYSNEAFELWFILHFEFLNTGMTREEYIPKLNKLLEKWLDQEYTKNSREMYDRLESWQEDAIANAKRLLNIYNPPRPEQDRPSTTVHLLVEELRKYIR